MANAASKSCRPGCDVTTPSTRSLIACESSAKREYCGYGLRMSLRQNVLRRLTAVWKPAARADGSSSLSNHLGHRLSYSYCCESGYR